MKKYESVRGSITVETAILLPFFIITVIFFVFVIRIYYVNEIIQHAISGACNEMSVYSLLYYETNAEDIIGGIEKFTGSDKVSDLTGNSIISAFVQQIGKDASDYVRAQAILVPVTKVLVKKNLSAGIYNSIDKRLQNLSLENGFNSIDFSGSRMLADEKSIDIVASYELKFPLLSQILPGIKMTQTASCCVWAGADGINADKDDEGETDSVWDKSNLERGRQIRKLQGANLPFNFPVIAIFKNGTATSIKSLNTDEAYYKNTANLKKQIILYINSLKDFEGGKTSSVEIDKSHILRKELRLIIPESQLLSSQTKALNECILLAKSKGITLNIIKAYGKESSDNKASSNKKN